MHIFTPARLALLLLGMAAQVHAASATCLDTPSWEDQGGDGCDWYEQFYDRCGSADGYAGDMGSATDHCCYCGGGSGSVSPPPTANPTPVPTSNPSKAPSPGPTNQPTPEPSHSPTPAIKSWDLELTSVNNDFGKESGSEITLQYKIGKGRQYEVFMLNQDCSTDITTGVVTHSSSTSDIEGDASNENLQVSVDIEKGDIATSNIWVGGKIKLCAKVQLKSDVTGVEVSELERVIQVDLDFKNDFQTTQNATFSAISLLSNETDAAVENYVEACTCDNSASFTCNTNTLGVNDFLNICVKSTATEMEINYLDSLKMVQGSNTLNIVSNQNLNDASISSKSKVAAKNGVHVASVIPASFFSYDSASTAEVSGVVFLKLSGSRRRLAVEIDRALQSAGDQESTFSMEVQLQKNELEVAADSNGNGATYAVKIGVVGVAVAAAFVTALMW